MIFGRHPGVHNQPGFGYEVAQHLIKNKVILIQSKNSTETNFVLCEGESPAFGPDFVGSLVGTTKQKIDTKFDLGWQLVF